MSNSGPDHDVETDPEAAAAQARIVGSIGNPRLMEAASALLDNDLAAAERLLRAHLKADPFDVAAIRMMAELAGRLGRYRDAENLLRRALELAPAFGAARANLATVLHRQNRPAEALAELDTLLAREPDNPSHANIKAAALGRIGEYAEAIELYEQVLQKLPEQPKIWMSYGHVLKTIGRQEDCISAYRRAIALRPALGEVWWSLANLKTVRLTAADIAAMRAALTEGRLGAEDRFHLDFALGKALEDAGDAADSFAHYAAANALRRSQIDYDPREIERQVRQAKAIFTPDFFKARSGAGCPAPDPIFILGMPRAGSTLIEQILASHSMVEGTMELPDIPALAARTSGDGSRYPEALAKTDPALLRTLGEEYLERTRIQRKSDKPFFIDKLPNNWLHTGLIHLILPNAKIIDARRHPLGSCFSNFKQHFARGQSFTYSLEDVGRYYRTYVDLMAHFDSVLPGRVHRVFYERMVEDPEGEIRALLAALGLPFEEACLRFHENDRAVRTASSEQVRRPINREGMEQWRPFEPWLDPLKQALGDVLDTYPDAPTR
jgi:tetratricopeptide (TPR) repeat protein